MQTPEGITTFTERTIYTKQGIYFEPFLAEDGRVGYRIVDQDNDCAETFIYLNPTTDFEGTPDVFVHQGEENEPAVDKLECFISVDLPRFSQLEVS